MKIALESEAEINAKKAESIRTYNGLNLLHIKSCIADILNLIGRNAIFDEYTKHDICHIDTMLDSLKWIIPDETKQVLSHSEWLMIVLAIYFHDMGMLVTKSEFDKRESPASGFSEFCKNVLFSGTNGNDYKAKVEKLTADKKDRYLYQEFVRFKHAERIRAWITGENRFKLDISEEIIELIDDLLSPFDSMFRRDLAIVCESHNCDDLDDSTKYKINQAYGQSDSEIVNLQYCAIILRTADLLHITKDRTPSIQFRIINPTDPISQSEWAKQKAVRRVSPKVNRNKEGVLDETIPRDTIDVYAYFENEDGFFGLTSYLKYAAEQIKMSYDHVYQVNKQGVNKYIFPWKHIDDTNIETKGFIRHAFEFQIDQIKILDLLTGHTLYNDTNVVLRELIQNSIDAIRLQYLNSSPESNGEITIKWNSHDRVLAVRDNGTGMTQEIIDNFLLKVGSSRYHDPDFLKVHPEFNSISRFGIGVLSSFMVSDEVDIITCHQDDEQARRLILRSVHGKYLIRLLDKNIDEVKTIYPHGTIFNLRIRQHIDMSRIADTAKYWVVKPNCKVTLQIDDHPVEHIGYTNLSDSLRETLRNLNFNFYEDETVAENKSSVRLRFVEVEKNGVSLAYVLRYNEYFDEWSFLTCSYIVSNEIRSIDKCLGISVEGIRVADGTPGYVNSTIMAIANIYGPNAPKTNVARSGLEITQEFENTLLTIYSIYAQHITDEVRNFEKKSSYSISRAVTESYYLVAPLFDQRYRRQPMLNQELFRKALRSIPCLLVEIDGNRKAMTLEEISNYPAFWTVDNPFFSSAEFLICQISSSVSLSALASTLSVKDCLLPKGPVVRVENLGQEFYNILFDSREIGSILINEENKRIDIKWINKSCEEKWKAIPERIIKYISRYQRNSPERAREIDKFVITAVPVGDIEVTTPKSLDFFTAANRIYVLPNSEFAKLIKKTLQTSSIYPNVENDLMLIFTLFVSASLLKSRTKEFISMNFLETELTFFKENQIREIGSRASCEFDLKEICDVFNKTNWCAYDTSLWYRRTNLLRHNFTGY